MSETTPHPGAVGGEAPAEHVAYQPLSLLAIAGFGVAVVYAAVVLLGFLAWLVLGSPWLMSLWTLLIPLAAVVLSLIARARIQRSEGTLAGLALTRWGITLSVLFGLIYTSYTAATYLVFRQQAQAFTQQWFAELAAGNTEKAFVLTLPPVSRPDLSSPNLRNDLENRFNTPGEMSRRGYYSDFLASPEVRLLLQAGPEVEIKPRGVSGLDYVQGGYQVKQTYQVTAPDWNYELLVTVHGVKPQGKEFQGRQWQVRMPELQRRTFNPTARGRALQNAQVQAQAFAMNWANQLRAGELDKVYLATRDPAERERLAKAGRPEVPSWLNAFVPPELFLPGYAEFTEGKLVTDPGPTFWAPAKARDPAQPEPRDEVLAELRKLFRQPSEGLGRSLEVERLPLLRWRTVGDRLQMLQDVSIALGSKYAVEGVLVLEADAKEAERLADKESAIPWRVAGLEPLRAREVTAGGPPGKPPIEP
jgi:hypothetical protein